MRASPAIASSLSLPLTTSFAGAQTLWWPSSTSLPPRIVLLFIPGNPGLSSYYIDFLHSIYSSPLIKSGIEILAVSHRGHAPLPRVGTNPIWGGNAANQDQARKGYGVGLADQVRHKVAVLDSLNRHYNGSGEGGERKTKVVVVGHSIGAWIGGEVLKARPEGLDGLHMLFPTLAWIGRTANATRLRWALINPVSQNAILPLPLLFFSLLPLWLLVWIISLVTGQPTAASLATAELLTTPGAVQKALNMAKEEFSTVTSLEPSTIDAIRTFTSDTCGGRVRSYWAAEDSDSWAPSWIRTQVETELGLQRVNLPPSLNLSGGKERRKSHVRTRSFSVSEHRSSPGSIPDLRNAKAIRKPMGEIVIEAQVVEPSDTEGEESGSVERRRAGGGNGEAKGMEYHYGRNRATSTHCRIGMPHAFCLKHSEDMAKIIASWIAQDHLREENGGKQ
ncbi:hypothetical protein NDA11_003667 [Ustilago hordei]|uniref:AB hydrolase-1 domain-containing protein n=1 Tax=Ustilago hordei TaxID=120017 RepID=I2FQY2_USTHO|nr:uncharacterized protein UHO2_05105 [Ustilago hordei]KAJ1043036.1 hypothetical protein NDA10_003440 [Ustilago hordei]KAJ1571215.1 hypothetical protein NDA12_002881 [Ustilago hordei]KAJ1571606.1 hypothetical protein NDA15_007692 [Ustilago hordei]KAJ1596055.1 hypothetical protein NDA11_003667 [Ustilago hordei]KAJ1596623.1 hypothetical protein NDA14_002179 [Ustilago hordei]